MCVALFYIVRKYSRDSQKRVNLKTRDFQKHVVFKNTWFSKTRDFLKHVVFKNTWFSKTRDSLKHAVFKNTWFSKTRDFLSI